MKSLDALKQHGDIVWNLANLLHGADRPSPCCRMMIPLTAASTGKIDVGNWKSKEDAA
jgi:hypothetical protein